MFFPWNHQIWMWICYIWECCLGFESHLNHLDYWQDWLLMHVELGLRSWGGSGGRLKGLARTQIPTNRNYAVEFHTFGEIAGVNHSQVQWSSLALGKPPSWSWLIPLPGKYAFTVSLGENLRTMRPALLLSLALRLQSCVRLVAKISSHLSLLMALQKLAGRDFQKNALLHGCSSLQGLDKWLAATGAPPLVSQLYYHNHHTAAHVAQFQTGDFLLSLVRPTFRPALGRLPRERNKKLMKS